MPNVFDVPCNDLRADLKRVASRVLEFKTKTQDAGKAGFTAAHDAGEVLANLTLAYRHLEDASMRLGKAIQAYDGGTSVYDRNTTVGA